MTRWHRFKALWTHRYHKYSHIALKYCFFVQEYLRFFFLKLTLSHNRKLVAILLSEQMGDIIASEPLLREVRKRHPNDYIVWMVRKAWVDLVQFHPDLDGHIIEYCVSQRIKLIQSGIFDQLYNLHFSHRNCRICQDDHINPIADQLGIDYETYPAKGDLLTTFSLAAGLSALEGEPRLYIPLFVQNRVDSLELPHTFIVLHCQSSLPSKNWKTEHWNTLVNWLIETYPLAVIEIGLENFVQVQEPQYINLCGKLTVLESAEVIRRAALFIGIESGPGHMANATDRNAIILMSPMLGYDHFMPFSGRYKRGENVTLLRHPGKNCTEIPFETVQALVKQKVNHILMHEADA